MYVVTGATGNTGEIVADKLLAAGVKVRVIGRDAKKLERFAQKGAEAFVADVTDAGAVESAFSGGRQCSQWFRQTLQRQMFWPTIARSATPWLAE
jgi:uncharacterized protein YbjT (DUF2867 family)